MSFRAPGRFNGATAVFHARSRTAIVTVSIVAVSIVAVCAYDGGETVCLNMTGGETDGEDGFGGVDGLGEEVGG